MIRKRQSSALTKLPVAVEVIERRIFAARSRKVMLDSDLAQLYGVTTFNLNKAVKRNLDRSLRTLCSGWWAPRFTI